jgi:hypothetical protein
MTASGRELPLAMMHSLVPIVGAYRMSGRKVANLRERLFAAG